MLSVYTLIWGEEGRGCFGALCHAPTAERDSWLAKRGTPLSIVNPKSKIQNLESLRLVFAPNAAQRVADLAERDVGFDAGHK